MSIAAEAGRIAVCLILLIVAIMVAAAFIRALMRVPYGTAADVGSAFAPIEMETVPVIEVDPEAPWLDRYRELHQPLVLVALCLAMAACRSSPTEPPRACPKVTTDTLPNSGGWTVTIVPPLSKTCQLVNKQP